MIRNINNPYKLARIISGMTAEQASEKLGISKDYLYRIESGKRKPGKDLEAKIKELYGR